MSSSIPEVYMCIYLFIHTWVYIYTYMQICTYSDTDKKISNINLLTLTSFTAQSRKKVILNLPAKPKLINKQKKWYLTETNKQTKKVKKKV